MSIRFYQRSESGPFWLSLYQLETRILRFVIVKGGVWEIGMEVSKDGFLGPSSSERWDEAWISMTASWSMMVEVIDTFFQLIKILILLAPHRNFVSFCFWNEIFFWNHMYIFSTNKIGEHGLWIFCKTLNGTDYSIIIIDDLWHTIWNIIVKM